MQQQPHHPLQQQHHPLQQQHHPLQQQQQQHQQQQPQQSSQMFGAPQTSLPSANVTTEQIQKLLEENKRLILAILENQNQGKLAECAQHQSQLQKNLMYLAAIADAQSQAPGASATPAQMTPQPTISQGYSMQHPQSGGSHPQQSQPQPPQQAHPQQQAQPPQQLQPQLQPQRQTQPQLQLQPQMQQPQQHQPQQQQGVFSPQMVFQLGAYQPHEQQQISSYLQQQAMMGSMGMRMGANNGIHPAMFSGVVGAAATNQMDPRGRQDTGTGQSDGHAKSSGGSRES